jgi:hypothetical protein
VILLVGQLRRSSTRASSGRPPRRPAPAGFSSGPRLLEVPTKLLRRTAGTGCGGWQLLRCRAVLWLSSPSTSPSVHHAPAGSSLGGQVQRLSSGCQPRRRRDGVLGHLLLLQLAAPSLRQIRGMEFRHG